MAKRPTTPSIRARQKRLLEYIGQTGRSNRQVAKDLGVSSKQLGNFIATPPKKLRSNFGRSPAYKKLYQEGSEKELKSEARKHGTKLTFRPLSAYTEPAIQQVRTNPQYPAAYQAQYTITGEQIQYLYSQHVTPQYAWARESQRLGIPVNTGRNFSNVRQMYRARQLNYDQYRTGLAVWAQIYGIDLDRFDDDLDIDSNE